MCFLASYTKEEAGVGVVSGLRGRLEWSKVESSSTMMYHVQYPQCPTTRIALRDNSDEELILMGVHFFPGGEVVGQVMTIQNLATLMNVMFPGVAHHIYLFILYRIRTEYILYTGNLHVGYIHIISMLQLHEYMKVGLLYGLFLCFHRTFDVNALGPSPCVPLER